MTAISLNNLAMVDIALEIDADYGHWIRKDLYRQAGQGRLGRRQHHRNFGRIARKNPQLKDKEAITFIETKGLDEMAADIAQKIKPVLVEISEIISYINNPDGDLKKTIRNTEQLNAQPGTNPTQGGQFAAIGNR